MKKWFLADNSATVDQILMIFFGRPSWNFKSDKWWKNQPSSTSASYAKHNKPSAPTYKRLIDNHTTGYLNLRKRYLVSNIRRTFVTFQWVALARPMMIACHLYCVRLGVDLSSSSGGHRDPRVTLVQRGYLIGPLIVCLLHCLSAITPFFWPKTFPGRRSKLFLGHFCQQAD